MANVDALLTFARSPENRCFVCGPGNFRGFHLTFQSRDGAAEAELTAQDWQQGWHGMTHGGALAAVLDEAMAYALFFRGVQGLTARMEVRFLHPATTGDRLTVSARITRDTRRLAYIEATIRRVDATIAEASGTFVKVGPITAESLLTYPETARRT
jgi:uncharacterized protein (TIGR00369 family)